MSRWWDTNPRPAHYEGAALPTELQRHIAKRDYKIETTNTQDFTFTSCLIIEKDPKGLYLES
jgi:hypothetical protein